jgi:cation diffusion facilitator CzcD-associated flavoprotein CzcO
MATDVPYSDVVCIGAGFSGICLGAQLQIQLGIDNFHIYEREAGVGGTWFVNQYPGCACDVPAAFYCLSFAQNSKWSGVICPYNELLTYIHGVATKYDLHRRTTLKTSCISARWNDNTKRWRLTLRNVETGVEHEHECKVFFSGVGVFGRPRSVQDLGAKNVDQFQGKVVHSARWDHSVDLSGKRIVVVGNGCEHMSLRAHIAPLFTNRGQRTRHRNSDRASDCRPRAIRRTTPT